MPNPDIGVVTCPHCENPDARVRRLKGHAQGSLYYSCENCGVIRTPYPKGQAWIEKNMRPLPAPKPPEPEAPTPPAPAPAPEPTPAPKRKTTLDF